jgi:hypothetical protein
LADKIEIPAGAVRVDPNLVLLIEQLEIGVRRGEITSLAVVTVGPNGQMAWPGFGNQISQMLIGAELMREDMKLAIRGNRSRIIQPGG